MALIQDVLGALEEAQRRQDELAASRSAWDDEWYARSGDPDESMAIHARRPDLYALDTARRRVAYLELLLEVFLAEASRPVVEESRSEPAITMTYEGIQCRLAQWVCDLVVHQDDPPYISDSQRLLLAWCAQLLTSNSPSGAHERIFSPDYLDAARSIFSLATSAELARGDGVAYGRENFDRASLLALSAFPFLEGMARRQLEAYVTVEGQVRQSFRKGRGGKDYRVGEHCSNLCFLLILIEEAGPSLDLRRRLVDLRGDVATTLSESVTGPSLIDPDELFWRLFAARNANLHGAATSPRAGMAALVLGVMITLSGIESEYDWHREWALMVSRQHSTLDPWATRAFLAHYPIVPSRVHGDRSIHYWPTVC